MDSRLADLERRVARAERQARALAGLVLVALSGGTIVLAARTAETRSPGSTVRARTRRKRRQRVMAQPFVGVLPGDGSS